MENQSGYTGLLQPLLDGARLGGWRGDTRRLIFTQVEELDERMQKLTHKLENARRDFDYEKAQRVLDKIDATACSTGRARA